MEIFFGVILFLLLLAIIFVYDALSWGLVMYKFWGWFILPVFTTLPAITFIQAIGLMFFISLFKSHFNGENIKDEFKKDTHTTAIVGLILPWLSLLFGWLAWQIWLV